VQKKFIENDNYVQFFQLLIAKSANVDSSLVNIVAGEVVKHKGY
jgi:hypothetical protein